MLYLDTSLELEGLTLFRDYNDPKRFHYMPRSPRLSTEGGAPMFQLLIYRRDITDNPDFREGDRPGGGFLTMTVDLGVPQGVLDAVRGELESRVDGDVELVPVMFEKGSVRVCALGFAAGRAPSLEGGAGGAAEGQTPGEAERGPRFVENIMGSAGSSLYGDNRAVFTIEMSHEGAQLMRASLQDAGASQVAIIYDLEYRGLMPAYECKITIEFRQSYSYLRSRFQANTLWFKADVDAEVEKLMKEGHIKIEEVDYLQSDPAKLAERALKLQEFAKELATWSFFRPGLTPGKVLADDRGNLTIYDPTQDAKKSEAGFTAPLAAAGTGRGSPGDVAGPRQQGESANPSTTRVGGQAAPPQGAARPQGEGAAEPAAGGGGAVEAWNRAGRPQAAFLLKSLNQEEQQTITYDLRQVAATKRSAAPQGSIRLLPGAAQLAGRIKEVDLNDPFFERIAGTVTTSADLASAGVNSMVVKLRYGVRDDGTAPKDTQEFSFTKTGDKGSYAFFMDRRRSVELEYQVVATYKAGFAIGSTETQATTPWIRTTTRNLDVDPRVVGAVFPVSLVLGNVDWNSVQSVQATVLYDHGGLHAERTVVLTQAAPAAIVPIRPPEGGTRRFRVRSVFFYGNVQEVVEAEGEGDAMAVINPPTSRAVAVSLSATDPLGRFRKLAVELSYAGGAGHPEQTTLLELPGDGATASWTLFRPDDRAEARYRYRVTQFGKDGTTDTGEWQETVERQLIVGDRFEGMLETEVRFLVPDFTAMGFMGAKLRLEYPEAPPQAKSTVEKFFNGAPQPFVWRVPRRRGGSRQYRYSVQWIRANATVENVGPLTTDEELLLIFPPVGG
jgi:hypothetical protein